MKFSIKFVVILVLLELSLVTAQTSTNIYCNFIYYFDVYTCALNGEEISGSEHQIINIRGSHMASHTNDDVRGVYIIRSNIPFVISQLFTTFPLLNLFEIWGDIGLTRIQWRAFHEAKYLNNIIIFNNSQLTTIEEYAFAGANSLTEIIIKNNSQLVKIEANAFSNTESLTKVTIMENPQLAFIGENTFNGAGNSSPLQIQQSSENNFGEISNLTEGVTLYNHRLKTFDVNESGSTGLKTLDLSWNQIETIHETAFNGLSGLKMLLLENNQIRELPSNLLNSLSQLETFNIRNNFLESLNGSFFANNQNILQLDFSNNLIMSLDGNLLAQNEKVLDIDFNDNHINAIGRSFFSNLNNLTLLLLQRNECIDGAWLIQSQIDFDRMLRAMNRCFDNSIGTTLPPVETTAPPVETTALPVETTGPPSETTAPPIETPEPPTETTLTPEPEQFQTFILKLRGSLILLNENGTEVARI